MALPLEGGDRATLLRGIVTLAVEAARQAQFLGGVTWPMDD
jgi:hypothetical protein